MRKIGGLTMAKDIVEVDVRGLSCPIPVVRTKKAMDANPSAVIIVFVDEMTQVENVSRLAKSRGYEVNVEKLSESFKLELKPSR